MSRNICLFYHGWKYKFIAFTLLICNMFWWPKKNQKQLSSHAASICLANLSQICIHWSSGTSFPCGTACTGMQDNDEDFITIHFAAGLIHIIS